MNYHDIFTWITSAIVGVSIISLSFVIPYLIGLIINIIYENDYYLIFEAVAKIISYIVITVGLVMTIGVVIILSHRLMYGTS